MGLLFLLIGLVLVLAILVSMAVARFRGRSRSPRRQREPGDATPPFWPSDGGVILTPVAGGSSHSPEGTGAYTHHGSPHSSWASEVGDCGSSSSSFSFDLGGSFDSGGGGGSDGGGSCD